MSIKTALTVDFSELLPRPPILSSHQSGWKHIQLVHFQLPAWKIPEIAIAQHTIALSSAKYMAQTELITAGRVHSLPTFAGRGYIGIFPTDLPIEVRWNAETEFTHCYLDANFLNRVAYESGNVDRVELRLIIPPTFDPLVWQLGSALQAVLANDAKNSCFYAESIATALAAHLLRFYATRNYTLREYQDGLPKYKLDRALEYINEHLSEDVSLAAISTELGIGQYYLCRLFKQSLGMSPHKYLVQQRVERSKQLLKSKETKIIDIAMACGFANPSHFARCFRQQIGISPKQFRLM
jgi:AraC family transcriptional regulator